MTNDNNKSQEILDALGETLTRILRIGYYEMSGQKKIEQTHEFANQLPEMCAIYDFATTEELSRAIYLMPDLLVSDTEGTENAGSNADD